MKAESLVRREGHEVGRYRDLFADAADAMLILDNDRRVVDANRGRRPPSSGATSTRCLGCLLVDLLVDAEEELAEAWRELMSSGESKRRASRDRGRAGVPPDRMQLSSNRRVRTASVHCPRYHRAPPARRAPAAVGEGRERRPPGRRDRPRFQQPAHGDPRLHASFCSATARRPIRIAHDLEEIQKAGQRAAALTQQLLAFSRKQVLVPKEVDLNQTVSSLRGMLRSPDQRETSRCRRSSLQSRPSSRSIRRSSNR